MADKKVIRFLTKNIPGKEPEDILWIEKISLKSHEKMLECLCFNNKAYLMCNEKERLINFWYIPDFVPTLEVIQVECLLNL